MRPTRVPLALHFYGCPWTIQMVCASFTPSQYSRTRLHLQHTRHRGRRAPAHRVLTSCSAEAAAAPTSAHYDSVLLAVVDANAYLSADTRSAVAAACKHVSRSGKLSVLFADAAPLDSSAVRLDTLRFHLTENGYVAEPAVLTEHGQNRAAAISDAADSVDAQLVVLSCGAVHAKAVEVHLLCEFLSAPLLLVP